MMGLCNRKRLAFVGLVGLIAWGCLPENGNDLGLDAGQGEQSEQWGSNDSPAYFDASLEYRFAQLPQSGEATQIPWAGSYWPVYKDSINQRWDGASSQSPSEKYGQAFGIANLADAVSKYHGIEAQTSAKACTENSTCDSSKGETCAMRQGASNGRCIPTWWGICHAWTPAAILEPEPVHPVTYNGVVFKVNDIKALVTLAYNKSNAKMLSGRCKLGDGRNEILYDTYGRPTDAYLQCRDTNPGTFHVLIANYLGLRKKALAEDRVFDEEVWNQPIRKFEVLEKRTVSVAEANKLVGATSTGGQTETMSGDLAKNAWSHYGPFAVTAGSPFKAVLSGNGDADLFVRFGSQPTASAYSCRPYQSGSAETCDLTVPASQTAAYVSVNGFAATSSFKLAVTYGGQVPTGYVFSTAAAQLFYLRTRLGYITESQSFTDGNLSSSIDAYTRYDKYEYILEADANGKINGGEWIGSSKRSHPDFIWLPLDHGPSSSSGGAITYDNVKMLLDMSHGSQPPLNDLVTKNETGTVAKGQWVHWGPYDVAEGSVLNALMTGSGDADLYVRAGSQPTSSTYSCRPYAGGSSESCKVNGPGKIYVSVNGWATTSDFKLAITYKPASAGGTDSDVDTNTDTDADTGTGTPQNVTANVSGVVAKDQWVHFGPYTLTVAGQFSAVMTGDNDADLYVRKGAQPTSAAYDCRPYKPLSSESCQFTGTGPVYVSAKGWAASTNFQIAISYIAAQ